MPASYQQTDSLDEIIAELIEQKPYHQDLFVTGVTVQVLFHSNETPLKLRGIRAYAYVKLTSLKDRALGQKDATIVVDYAPWMVMDPKRQVALIDHELYHLCVCKDKDGKNATDDLHRPKMSLRKHDIEVGWFVEIAAEHRDASIEVMQATGIALAHRQTLFAFALREGADTAQNEETELRETKPVPDEAPDFQSTEGEGTKEDLGRILDVPNAGQTSVGAVLDVASVVSDQPPFVMIGFERDDWTLPAFRKAFKAAARKAIWPEASISLLHSQLMVQETVEAMKQTLQPHVVTGSPTFEELMSAAKADYPDGSKLRTHFSKIIALFPKQYPGGDSEHNFNAFQSDIAQCVEADIQQNRTQ